MQYDVKNPQEYLDLLDDDWRKEKLLEIRSLILEAHPEIQEDIEYKMLCYKSEEISIFHLNAQKKFVGLYVGNILKVDPELKFLSNFDIGKGCIRIKKNNSITNSGLKAFIEQSLRLHSSGTDISC